MSAKLLEGKIALVTGGGTGIGFGTARRMAEEGATVYISGRRFDVLEKSAKKIGENVIPIQADISIKTDMERVASVIESRHGALDILFANAGYCLSESLPDITEEFIDRMYNSNIKGTLFTVQSMLPILREGASIILTSSMTAMIGLPGYTCYAATKCAIRGMAKVWTTELKSRKIRVNVVSPGAIPTEGYETVQGMTPEEVQGFMDRCSQEIPAGRGGDPKELGDAVVFLASDMSTFVNGENITVDGGQTQVYAGRL